MVDHQGRVLATARNHVMKDGHVFDPTGHVERQLSDWYWANHKLRKLPAPKDLTIVSSLDPCLMCSGAIMVSGFRAISITLDSFAGICSGQAGHFEPLKMPGLESHYHNASSHFSYFGIDGVRPYIGSDGIYCGVHVGQDCHTKAQQVFHNTLDQVKLSINSEGQEIAYLNPALASSAVRSQLHRHIENSHGLSGSLGTHDQEQVLVQRLFKAPCHAKAKRANFDSAALLDFYGNVLMVCGSASDKSPIRSAMLELTRNYALARVTAPKSLSPFLPPVANCTFISLFGPDKNDAAVSLMEMGAYGSSIEGPRAADMSPGWQYVIPSKGTDQTFIDAWCAKLPPLYSDVIRVRPVQVAQTLTDRMADFALNNHSPLGCRRLRPSAELHCGVG